MTTYLWLLGNSRIDCEIWATLAEAGIAWLTPPSVLPTGVVGAFGADAGTRPPGALVVVPK